MWYWHFRVKTPTPCSFCQSLAPTTSTTLYIPPHTSPAPPSPTLSTPDRYQVHALSISILGSKTPTPLILSIPGPHHFNNPIYPTPHASCIPMSIFSTP